MDQEVQEDSCSRGLVFWGADDGQVMTWDKNGI